MKILHRATRHLYDDSTITPQTLKKQGECPNPRSGEAPKWLTFKY